MGNLMFVPAALLHLIGVCLLLKARQGSEGKARYWFLLALSFTEFAYSSSILMYRFLPFHAHFYIIINSVLVLMYASLMHLVLFDRFLEIYLHLRYETICTVVRTKKLLLSIVIFLVILSIPQSVMLEKRISSIFTFYMKYFWSTVSASFLVSSIAVYLYIYAKLQSFHSSTIHVARRQPEMDGNPIVTDDSMQQPLPYLNQTANFSDSTKHSPPSNSCGEDTASKYRQSLFPVCKSHNSVEVARLADSAIQNVAVFDKVTDISGKRFDSDDSDGDDAMIDDRGEENNNKNSDCNNNNSNLNNNNNNNATNITDYYSPKQVSEAMKQTAGNQTNQISDLQRNEPDPSTSSTTSVTTVTPRRGTHKKLIQKNITKRATEGTLRRQKLRKQLVNTKKKLFLPTLLVASFVVFWVSPVMHIFFRLTIFGHASIVEYIFMNTLVVFGICFDAFAYILSYKPVRRYLKKKLRAITNSS